MTEKQRKKKWWEEFLDYITEFAGKKTQKKGTNKLVLTLKEGMNMDFESWDK